MAKAIRKALGSDVRAWAKEKGVEVGTRGRFSAEVQEAFNKDNRGVMRYTPGNVATVPLKVRVMSASGKTRLEVKDFDLKTVRTAAGKPSKRGPLASADLAAAAKALSVAVPAKATIASKDAAEAESETVDA